MMRRIDLHVAGNDAVMKTFEMPHPLADFRFGIGEASHPAERNLRLDLRVVFPLMTAKRR